MKIVKLKYCRDYDTITCSYIRYNEAGQKHYCTHPENIDKLEFVKSKNVFIIEIPKWCPLEDYKNENI